MRHLALTLALLAAAPAFAQSSKLEPLPAVPPPPPEMLPFDAALEPQVTIRKRDNETVEEFRAGGKLYMIKVTPAHGVPYYLVDDRGDGNFARRDALDGGARAPLWVIKQF
jgi:hypothetical protein